MDLAQIYAKFRGSKGFLVGLVSFVATWMTVHFFTGWDRDWGMLNLFLSSEASISLAFFTMLSDRQDAHLNEMMTEIKKLSEANLALQMAESDTNEQLLEAVNELHESKDT